MTPNSSRSASQGAAAASPANRRVGGAVKAALDELRGLKPRLLAMNLALSVLPDYTLVRVRSGILRLAGFEIGFGSTLFGVPKISGDGAVYERLRIGRECAINTGFVADLGAEITIGDHVYIGHDVMILTTSHRLGPAWHRAGAHHLAPVTIGSGTWICARATILPGVKVGEGAVISAGAVVNKDVPPNSIVAGTPARVVVPKLR
jgi:maltose O-acetyltransferase